MARICPNCGTQNADDNEFCQSCGKPMAGAPSAAEAPQAPSPGVPPTPPGVPPQGAAPQPPAPQMPPVAPMQPPQMPPGVPPQPPQMPPGAMPQMQPGMMPPGAVPPGYQGQYVPPGYQSPYYMPAAPGQPVHRTHLAAIAGGIIGTLGVLTVCAAIFLRHPTPPPPPPPPPPTTVPTTLPTTGPQPTTVPTGQPTAPPAPSPTGAPPPPPCSGCQTLTTNTFSLQYPSGWSVSNQTNTDATLKDSNSGGILWLTAGTVSSATTAQNILQDNLAGFQKTDPNAAICQGTGPSQGTIGGINGMEEDICYTFTPQGGSAFPVVTTVWASTNSAGTTIYVLNASRATSNAKAYGTDVQPIINSITWKVS